MTILVKFLIVKNHHLKDGYKDIKLIKILQEEIKNQYLTNGEDVAVHLKSFLEVKEGHVW
jgi:hypothetical protein